MFNNQTNIQQQEQEMKHYLKLEEPMKFKGTVNGEITTTLELSKRINTLFGKIYKDYEASIVIFNPNGSITATLYFKDKGGGHIAPLTKSTKGTPMSSIERIKIMNQRHSTNRTLRVSDELRDVLTNFMVPDFGGKPNWDRNVTETNDTYGNRSNIYVEVNGIDVNKLLRTMYGTKTEDGDHLEYNVTYIKALGNVMQGTAQNYIIKIEQYNASMIDKLAIQVGNITTVNSIPMVRGY